MKKQVIFGLVFAAAGALFAAPTPAFATITSSVSLNTVFTGATPAGTPPWLTATFMQTGSNTGTLTLTSNLTSPNFLQGLASSSGAVGWAFYLDQSLSGITCSSGTCGNSNSGFNAGGFNTGPVGGTFNLGFGWGPGSSHRFVAGSSAVYDLTFSSALTGNPFAANSAGFMSVAHVQGITVGGSGWIVNGATSVPEPAELGMFGLGLLALGLFAGLRRRRL
ncbi:MAG TPA: PEP-CTERM sorting domain-containing protein [Rhodanobacteraceae bacterium]|nr:PEP-CTERM sorting domain-containing protein [Rhodanobacteraceae bacterium]